jgi:hypothetical protein
MHSPYGHCSLYLCSRQHDFFTNDISSFTSALQKIELISREITTITNGFYTGSRFLDYIAYLGCSPAIQFEPGTGKSEFCHIKLHHYHRAHLILSKKQAKAPHCPHCRKPLAHWHETTTSGIKCNHCHTPHTLDQLNWRKMAGYARLFIEITDIFPKEAIPQQLLLDKLVEITDKEWQYFYSCR